MQEELKTFTGTKTIQAKPMTRGAYNILRGWTIPEDEDPKEKGYLVVYPLQPNKTPNVKGYDGYTSWSPKDAFDGAYHEDKVEEELTEEDAKHYFGKKIVRAKPTTLGRFDAQFNCPVDPNENPNADGYAVFFTDEESDQYELQGNAVFVTKGFFEACFEEALVTCAPDEASADCTLPSS